MTARLDTAYRPDHSHFLGHQLGTASAFSHRMVPYSSSATCGLVSTAHDGTNLRMVTRASEPLSNGPSHGTKKGFESELVKRHYYKMINEEFRQLQLDSELQSKSIFDLIDYCELVYEKASEEIHLGEKGLKTYIRGYLIFNYFINSFIMLHFGGFDEFIKTNEYDFIIYLNVFAFYNTDETISTYSNLIPLKELRRLVIDYLEDKKMLKFDVKELYAWLYEYIEYLKQKDQDGHEADNRSEEEETKAPVEYKTLNPALLTAAQNPSQASLLSKSQVSHDLASNLQKLDLNQSTDSFLDLYNSDSEFKFNSGEDRTGSLSDFADRFPVVHSKIQKPAFPSSSSLKAQQESTFSSKPTRKAPPPIPTQLPPGLTLVKESKASEISSSTLTDVAYPSSSHNADQTYLPYPLQQNMSYEDFSAGAVQSNGSSLNAFRARNRLSMPVPPTGYSNIGRSQTSPETWPNAVTQFNPAYQVPQFQYQQNYQQQTHQQQFYPQPTVYQSPEHPMHMQNIAPTPPSYQPVAAYIPPFNSAPGTSVGNSLFAQQSAHRHARMQRKQTMRDLAICGLKNFGSSCYINSTIQLLFGIEIFKNVFSNAVYTNYITRPKYLAALRSHNKTKDGVLLSEAVSSLLKSFQIHGGTAIAPTKFIRISSLLKPDLNIPYEQQDAQEFLLFILDRLHEELSNKGLENREISYESFENYIKMWKIQIKLSEKGDYFKWFTQLVSNDGNSPVHDAFQGHLQNKLICDQCGYESITYSPFTILSLPIPDNNGKVVDLSECLRYYTQDEILTGDNAWNCPKCHKQDRAVEPSVLDGHPVFNNKKSGIFKFSRRSKSPAKEKHKLKTSSIDSKISISTKKLNFIKLPNVLFIHLSRFSMYNLTDKLDTVIAYPLKLVFNNYSSEGRSEISYKLSGVINHYGNLKSGHYTSLINKSTINQSHGIDNLIEPFWCDFDDENVRCGVNFGELRTRPNLNHHSKDVYVLCYERI